jgi:AcrR family transcriptional regulator
MVKNVASSSYHKTDLKRTLLEALRQELREHGPEDVSLRRIAERAGVSHAAPYRHFKGKDGLLAAFCWRGQAEFTARLAAAREGAPVAPADRLFRLGFAYLDFARENIEAFRLMFSATGIRTMAANPPPDLQDGRERYYSFGILIETVKECQTAGVLDPGEESVTLGLLIWSFVHGLAFIRAEGLSGAPEKAAGVKPADVEPAVMKVFRKMILCKAPSNKEDKKRRPGNTEKEGKEKKEGKCK